MMQTNAYLVGFSLKSEDSSLLERLQESVPIIDTVLRRLSKVPPELLYRSADGGTFGYLITSDERPVHITKRVDSPPSRPDGSKIGSPLQEKDQFFVLEIGTQMESYRVPRARSWIQDLQAEKLLKR